MKDFAFNDLPRQAVLVQGLHEWIRVELFHIEDALATPLARQHHLGTNHRRHTRRITDCLGLHFLVALLVVADIVDVNRLGLTLKVQTTHLATNARLTLRHRAQGRRVREQGLQEL